MKLDPLFVQVRIGLLSRVTAGKSGAATSQTMHDTQSVILQLIDAHSVLGAYFKALCGFRKNVKNGEDRHT